MELKKITYFIDGKNKTIKVKLCDTPLKKFMGLMFKRNSPPLLFVFNKSKKLAIHSFFCKPFRAIWLDEKMQTTKFIDVERWKPNFSGRGKYILEVPSNYNKVISTVEKRSR